MSRYNSQPNEFTRSTQVCSLRWFDRISAPFSSPIPRKWKANSQSEGRETRSKKIRTMFCLWSNAFWRSTFSQRSRNGCKGFNGWPFRFRTLYYTNNNRGYGIRNNSSFRICSNPCFPSSLWRVSFPSRANWFLCSKRIRRSSTIPFNRFCIAGKKPQATIFRCEVSVDRSNESADLTKCFELRSESSRESVLCALFLRNASLLSMELRFVVVFMCRACNFSRTSFNPAHRSLPRCAFSRWCSLPSRRALLPISASRTPWFRRFRSSFKTVKLNSIDEK